MREIVIYGLVGCLFLICQITGHDLAQHAPLGNIEWTAGYAARLLAISLAGGALFGVACRFFGGYVRRLIDGKTVDGKPADGKPADRKTVDGKPAGRKLTDSEPADGISADSARKAGGLGLISMGLLLLSWLPGYLAYYPGICAYDATIQTGQIVSGAYNDHHPIAHTLLIAGSMSIGEGLFGSVNAGIGLLVFLQMLLLAAVFSRGIVWLYRKGVRRSMLVCLQIFGMLYPFHMYMSVSLIKDVWFTVFFLLQMLALCRLVDRELQKAPEAERKKEHAAFFIGAVGMQVFRANGRYAMLVLLAVCLAAVFVGKARRRFWARLSGECAIALVAGSLCLSGLFRVTGAEQGDRREMLSMPIQQLARCMLYHGGVGARDADDGTMEERDRALIRDFLLDESYLLYRPEISDPVKSHTNTYVVRYRTKDFAETYLRLLGAYPGEFINAALAVNAGYLYPDDVTHAHVNENGKDRGLGYVQTRWVEEELNPRGIYKASKWEWLHEKLEDWADGNAYLHIPVLKYIFVPGTFLWLYLLLAGHLAVRRQYGRLVPLALPFGYYLTLFLGPVVQLRYVYPLMIALPFAALYLTGTEGTEHELEKKR